jgi:tetratricopeptide (TPR) repeat protein
MKEFVWQACIFRFLPGGNHDKLPPMRITKSAGQIYLYCAIFVISFALYLWTAPPDIISGANTGELVAAGDTAGIAHPTGYPTWTATAHIFTHSLPFADKAFRATVFSVLIGSLTLVFLYALIATLFGNGWLFFPVLTAFALDPLFWIQCISVEVYGFHIFLTTVFLFGLVRGRKSADHRYTLLAVFFLALALTNHLLSLFYLPLLLLIDPKTFSPGHRRGVSAVAGTVLLVLGLSAYIYLPVRASADPLIRWHNPANYRTFTAHVTGKQFHSLMTDVSPTPVLSRVRSLPGAIQTPVQFLFWFAGIPGLLLLLTSSARKQDRIAGIFFLAGIVLFPLFYSIHDIDSYFLPLVWTLYIASVYLVSRLKIRRGWIITATAVIAATGLVYAAPEIRLLKKPLIRNYGKLMLSSVPCACRFFYQGDTAMNSIALLAGVEHFRDDLVLVDKNRNLQPITFGGKKPGGNATAASFRQIGEYAAFSPNGMAFIPRSFGYHSRDIVDISRKLLLKPLEPKSRWNPYRSELQIQIVLNLAENECEYGDWKTGLDLLETAYDHASSNDIKRYIASMAAGRGQIDTSIRMTQRILEHTPRDPYTLNNLAFYHYLAGYDLDTAERLARDGMLIKPVHSDIAVTYYRILLALGKLDTAADIETRFPAFIDPSLAMQREILTRLSGDIPVSVQAEFTDNQITTVMNRLPLPVLLPHYRLLMIRQLETGAFSAGDFIHFAEISDNLGYPHAALYLLSKHADLYDPDDYRDTLNMLHKTCFNLSLVTQ